MQLIVFAVVLSALGTTSAEGNNAADTLTLETQPQEAGVKLPVDDREPRWWWMTSAPLRVVSPGTGRVVDEKNIRPDSPWATCLAIDPSLRACPQMDSSSEDLAPSKPYQIMMTMPPTELDAETESRIFLERNPDVASAVAAEGEEREDRAWWSRPGKFGWISWNQPQNVATPPLNARVGDIQNGGQRDSVNPPAVEPSAVARKPMITFNLKGCVPSPLPFHFEPCNAKRA